MTPLSRRSLAKSEEEKIRSVFLGELVRIGNAKEMLSLLGSLLSESEFLMIAKRLVAFVMVEEGRSDVEIGKMLHVTRATANRFRVNYLRAKDKQEPVVGLVEKVKERDVMRDLLESLLLYSVRAIGGRAPKRGIF